MQTQIRERGETTSRHGNRTGGDPVHPVRDQDHARGQCAHLQKAEQAGLGGAATPSIHQRADLEGHSAGTHVGEARTDAHRHDQHEVLHRAAHGTHQCISVRAFRGRNPKKSRKAALKLVGCR